MLFSKKYTIGLDIQEDSIRVVLLKIHVDRFELIGLNAQKWPGKVIQENELFNTKMVSETINKLFLEAIPKTIKPSYALICTIPESKTFLHIFTFPTNLHQREIENALKLELEKIIPYSISEIYFDFQTLIKDDQNQKILVACIQKKIADQMLNILESCELKPTFFAIRNQAILAALSIHNFPNQNLVICDISSSLLATTSIKNGQLVMCDFIHLKKAATESNHDRELNYQNTLNGILEIIKKGETQKDKIGEIILSGSALEDESFQEYLQKSLSFPVSIANPWEQIDIKKSTIAAISQNHEIKKQKAFSFATAIGLALKGQIQNKKPDSSLNLIPDSIKEKFYYRKIARATNIICALFLLFNLIIGFTVLSLWANFYYQMLSRENTTEMVRNIQSGTRYQDLKKEITAFNNEVSLIDKLEQNIIKTSEIFANFQNFLSEDISLSTLNYDHKTATLTFDGIAKTRESIISFKNNLKKFPYQKDITSPLSNLDKKENISFTITISLNSNSLPRLSKKTN